MDEVQQFFSIGRKDITTTTTTTISQPYVQDYPGELVPEGQTILDFAETNMMGWQWHQLNHMQAICTSLQHLISQIFTGRMPFLTPNQQRQRTEGLFSRLTKAMK